MKKRWFAPEVIQTSMMDCGPASLKCLFEGIHIPISYGRLREACQTDVDGTSIDMIEQVANQLGVVTEQVLIPVDHIFLPAAQVLPAMAVIRQSNGANHFVVVWRKFGPWVQIMDPATGRRWLSCKKFIRDIYHHELIVPAQEWLEWAISDQFVQPLQKSLTLLGIADTKITGLLNKALEAGHWYPLACLDASIRLCTALVSANGIRKGNESYCLISTLVNNASLNSTDCYQHIPANYWSTQPVANIDSGSVLIRGAVLLTISGRHVDFSQHCPINEQITTTLSLELSAALTERPIHPLKSLIKFLSTDGILSPLALVAALTVAAGAVLIETLLFRGLFEIAKDLSLPGQRLGAIVGLLVFISLLMLFEIPVVMESQRLGRLLENRLRMALLSKLPHLSDRYFNSRPISDMAERSHSLYLTRNLPSLGIQFVQSFWDIIFTLVAIFFLNPASGIPGLLLAVSAIVIPLICQPLLNESDLKVHTHSGALFSFYLDALLGLVPIRAHKAERSIRTEHEDLLVEWSRASQNMVRLSILINGIQSLISLSLVGFVLTQHFLNANGVNGSDLLLVYWLLKLPAAGHKIAGLMQQYPTQRSILVRLLEPLSAPEEIVNRDNLDLPPAIHTEQNKSSGMSIEIKEGKVVAAGHALLKGINVSIMPREHIAIVGASGSGKSSLLGLLLGWHRLAEGHFVLDGQPMSAQLLEQLRAETAWVDPAIQVWNKSFLDNLTYSCRDDGLDRTASAINKANLRNVLQHLPQGLQNYLGEGGALISGGEGQRVRLARALMQNHPRLVLLDEPFRGMDRQQRGRLLVEARQWWQDSSLICVTHDVNETLSFSRVLVVEAGRIVEDGFPSQLASKDTRYRDLLHGEEALNQKGWKDKQWRKISLLNGIIKTPETKLLPENEH